MVRVKKGGEDECVPNAISGRLILSWRHRRLKYENGVETLINSDNIAILPHHGGWLGDDPFDV